MVAIFLLHDGRQPELRAELPDRDQARAARDAQDHRPCVGNPAQVAQALIDRGFTQARPEYVQQALRDTPYDRWRDYDAEDTIRFYALRLRDLGFVKAVPQQIIADGTD